MADYRDHYTQLSAAGASVIAVSVDTAAQSEALRAQLSLPFSLLCDTERHVIREWNLLDASERGGIAKPSVFIIEPGLLVRYAAVDTVVRRVPGAEVLSELKGGPDTAQIRRKTYLPLLGDWMRAFQNGFRKR